MRQRKLTGIAERVLLGVAMSVAAFAAEWILNRRMKRRSAKAAAVDASPGGNGSAR